MKKIRVLCVGAGHLGRSHALAYHKLPGFEIVGLVTRSAESRARLNAELGGGYADGSVGWYEAGWGPMMSEEAFFVKGVIGPKGCVSIVAGKAAEAGKSADVDSYSAAQALKVHHAALGPDGKFLKPDEIVPTEADPGHDGLCEREQVYFERAICVDLDLTTHMDDAVNSMRIVYAADRSFREGRTVEL